MTVRTRPGKKTGQGVSPQNQRSKGFKREQNGDTVGVQAQGWQAQLMGRIPSWDSPGGWAGGAGVSSTRTGRIFSGVARAWK